MHRLSRSCTRNVNSNSMKRRRFLSQATGAALGTVAGARVLANESSKSVSVPATEATSSAYPLLSE